MGSLRPTLPLLLGVLLLGVLLLATAGRAEISASKRAFIEELLVQSAGAGTANEVAEMVLAELATVYGSLVDEVLASEPDLSTSDRKLLRTELADFDTFAKAFREQFEKRIDLQEIIEVVYVPLYDRHFEEAELREIVAFYRSPPGRKMIQVMPGLIVEGRNTTLALLQPRVMALVGEVLAQRRSAILP